MLHVTLINREEKCDTVKFREIWAEANQKPEVKPEPGKPEPLSHLHLREDRTAANIKTGEARSRVR